MFRPGRKTAKLLRAGLYARVPTIGARNGRPCLNRMESYLKLVGGCSYGFIHIRLNDCRPTMANFGGPFECVGQLEDAPIIPMPAHDLQTHRQS